MPAIEQERTLWVRRENERRKGRKGRKPPASIQRVGFVNDINHLDVHGGGRFAPLGVAETGGNSIPGLAYRLRKLRKPLKSKPASPRLPKKTYAATPSALRIEV
jgi:hypothetical protein